MMIYNINLGAAAIGCLLYVLTSNFEICFSDSHDHRHRYHPGTAKNVMNNGHTNNKLIIYFSGLMLLSIVGVGIQIWLKEKNTNLNNGNNLKNNIQNTKNNKDNKNVIITTDDSSNNNNNNNNNIDGSKYISIKTGIDLNKSNINNIITNEFENNDSNDAAIEVYQSFTCGDADGNNNNNNTNNTTNNNNTDDIHVGIFYG